MKRKGFTLIELLAVIVVLAIIALIATPIVMNTIERSKKGAAERTADNYIDAVETAVATKRLEGDILEGTYTINDKGNLEGNGLTEPLVIEMNGNKPSGGTITIKDGQVTTDSRMTIGDYDVAYNPTNKKYEATKKESSTKTYNNGEIVYFNVTTGEKCSSSDYTETQSKIGAKEGCMKFYAFNDDGGDTINLLLDHSTTGLVVWVSQTDYVAAGGNESDYGEYGKNDKGPLTVLAQLKEDTSSWKGTITPSNYTMDQTGQKSNANYTINYSTYKAKLITAQEVAQITGNTSWDEKLSTSDYYYFDSKTTTASDTCNKNGDTSGCQYGWLYDRTSSSCTTYGCLNNTESESTYGYWTASSDANSINGAWSVNGNGFVNGDGTMYDINVAGYDNASGVRPVITVLKSQLG